MATTSNKTYPKRNNRSQVNYNYKYFDYDSCTEGMSSDEEEIDNIFLNEYIDEINNRSDDLRIDVNVEDDIDLSSAPAPKKKTQIIQRRKGKQNKVTLSSTQPVVSTFDNSNMYKSYEDQDVPNVLPCFALVRKPGFYLDLPLLRGKYVTPIEFFHLYFTDDMINDNCLHTNAYAWANITQKQYYADHQGPWKEVTLNELKRLLALIICFALVKVNHFHDYWSTKSLYRMVYGHEIC